MIRLASFNYLSAIELALDTLDGSYSTVPEANIDSLVDAFRVGRDSYDEWLGVVLSRA